MRIPRTASSLTLLVGIAATTTSIPVSDRAVAAVACPQFLARYCVIDKDGSRHAAETNPCLAREKGMTALHVGTCEPLPCTSDIAPVCSNDPTTHMQKTYSNLCASDIANAALIHKGACGGQQ